jgi:hypothetical protein
MNTENVESNITKRKPHAVDPINNLISPITCLYLTVGPLVGDTCHYYINTRKLLSLTNVITTINRSTTFIVTTSINKQQHIFYD